jgi:hypothetical protein
LEKARRQYLEKGWCSEEDSRRYSSTWLIGQIGRPAASVKREFHEVQTLLYLAGSAASFWEHLFNILAKIK